MGALAFVLVACGGGGESNQRAPAPEVVTAVAEQTAPDGVEPAETEASGPSAEQAPEPPEAGDAPPPIEGSAVLEMAEGEGGPPARPTGPPPGAENSGPAPQPLQEGEVFVPVMVEEPEPEAPKRDPRAPTASELLSNLPH